MRKTIYFFVDMYLRLFAKSSGKEIESSTGKIRLVKSKGRYGIWLYDYTGIKDFVWINSIFDRVVWRAAIIDAMSYSNIARSISIRQHKISCKRERSTLTLTVGRCVISFDTDQVWSLAGLLDGLPLK